MDGSPVAAGAAPTFGDVQQLVDTRLLGKPTTLHGRDGEYTDWAFIMQSYLCCISTDYQRILKVIEAASTVDELASLSMSAMDERHQSLSASLHHILTMTTRDKALRCVQAVEDSNGYLAWHRLKAELVPLIQSRFLGMLQGLLQVSFKSEESVLDLLSDWERQVKSYEDQSGEPLTDSVKKAVVLAGLPEAIRGHLQMQKGIDTYEILRVSIKDLIMSRRTWHTSATKEGNPWRSVDPNAMQVDAVKGGKSKGKKGSEKGKGKSDWKSEWKTDWKPDWNQGKSKGKKGGKSDSGKGKGGKDGKVIECFICGKKGHYARDCWGTKKVSNVEEEASSSTTTSSSNQGKKAKPAVACIEEEFEAEDGAWVFGVLSSPCIAFISSMSRAPLLLDSGASVHVCPPGYGSSFSTVPTKRSLYDVQGGKIGVHGDRLISTTLMSDDGSQMQTTIPFVVSDVSQPILSVGMLVAKGYDVLFSSKHGSFISKDIFSDKAASISV